MMRVHLKTSVMLGRNEKGMVLVAVVLLMSVLALFSTTSVLSTRTGLQLSSNYRLSQEVLYIAQGGAEYGLNRLRAALNVAGGNTSSVVPPTIPGYTFENTGSFLALSGGVVLDQTITGQHAGLTADRQRYIITSSVRKNDTNARATVVYEIEDQRIPLFEFGIFFDHDMEILPSSGMTFNAAGPIHSNGNIYFYSSVDIDSRITAFGNIIRGRKDSAPGTAGTVRVKDAGGNYQTLTIASSTSTWRADAVATWNGRVRTSAHDIQPLKPPLPSGGNPIDILGTGAGSLYQKSGLRIINGVAYDKNGALVNLIPGGNNPISVAYNALYDGREGRWMDIVQIDVNLLRNNTVAMNKLSDPPVGGQAGILYVSTTSGYMTDPAVRLVNGDDFQGRDFSFVTDKPLYIRGDFNAHSGKAGIFADAVTVLSNNWNDFYSNWSISYRNASSTTVRAAIMAGNRDTVWGQYSGGVENLLRLLENWSGRTLTYSGSLACLWQSVRATHSWPGTGTVYNPPTRNWSYGINSANKPPGTPLVRNVQRIGWKQVFN
jgi:hypothetical protein